MKKPFVVVHLGSLCAFFFIGCGVETDTVQYKDLPEVIDVASSESGQASHGMVTSGTGAKFEGMQCIPPSDTLPTEMTDAESMTDATATSSTDADAAGSGTVEIATAEGVAESGVTPENGVASAEMPADGSIIPTIQTDSVNPTDSTDAAARTVVSTQTGLVGPADQPVIENVAAEEREIKLLIAEKKFVPERGTKALRVSYDDIDLLKVLNMEPVPNDASDHFPEWLSDLNGKPVRIRGFMYPTFEATGLTAFTMARDNGICCFVKQPKIYDIIGVSLAEGVTTDYIDGRPFDIEGTFHIEPESDEQGLYRLYRVSNARVLR